MELCTAFFRTSSLFCGKMLVTTNVISQWVLPKGRDFKKKKHKPELASLDGLLCVCFDLSEFGTPRTCKKKRKQWTKKKTLGLDDQWTDWTHRRETADAQCFGMNVACACSDSVDLLQGLVLLLRGSGGIEKNGSSSD